MKFQPGDLVRLVFASQDELPASFDGVTGTVRDQTSWSVPNKRAYNVKMDRPYPGSEDHLEEVTYFVKEEHLDFMGAPW